MTPLTLIPSADGSPPEFRTTDGKDPLCLNDVSEEEADQYAATMVEAFNEKLAGEQA